ncbi:uncharacterized protein MONOS_8347 [Monocercomonoides exilis]|uniref:uncharacterized protein n=1 Tax=Monocercomonoides exilis TaxID=2049356 RepID=UPI003559EBB5|nr:hypothetical protein MONOS_8347 [Monocercomonoides exilis]|eukprot:MONOS_8347.1-p1 / transcript=MONOS_8347.1 / gene=MONOS_8347 / organism=Monocercomonoides_exilis_PA203 / gene_product=unspecified product / transcript_product=unspecified product / location=Mono_scaffold00313:39369-40866(+) / protein_length=400 / sequence_SO=supercontig / SO=protein_coding / is_pseudo=false
MSSTVPSDSMMTRGRRRENPRKEDAYLQDDDDDDDYMEDEGNSFPRRSVSLSPSNSRSSKHRSRSSAKQAKTYKQRNLSRKSPTLSGKTSKSASLKTTRKTTRQKEKTIRVENEDESESEQMERKITTLPQPPPLRNQVGPSIMRILLSWALFPFRGIVFLLIWLIPQVIWGLVEIIVGFAYIKARPLLRTILEGENGDILTLSCQNSTLLQAFLIVDGFILLLDLLLHLFILNKPAAYLINHPPSIDTPLFSMIPPEIKTEKILYLIRIISLIVIRAFQLIWYIVGAAALATQHYYFLSYPPSSASAFHSNSSLASAANMFHNSSITLSAPKTLSALSARPAPGLSVVSMMALLIGSFSLGSYVVMTLGLFLFVKKLWEELDLVIFPSVARFQGTDRV